MTASRELAADQLLPGDKRQLSVWDGDHLIRRKDSNALMRNLMNNLGSEDMMATQMFLY